METTALKSNFNTPSGLNLDWVEKILPQLILVSPSTPGLSDADRKLLQDCIRKCEYLLASREQIEKMNSVIRKAETFNSEDAIRSNIHGFFAKQSFVGDKNTKSGQLLYDLRFAVAQRNLASLPKDVLHWLVEWDKRVDAASCDARIHLLHDSKKRLEQYSQMWSERFRFADRGTLSLVARLRVLRFSRRVKKQQKETQKIQDFVKKQGLLYNQYLKHVQHLCGLVSVFFRLPTGSAGEYSQRVGQMALLSLEKDLSVEMKAQRNSMKMKVEKLRNVLSSKVGAPVQLRKKIHDLEAQKNSSLVSLYAKRNVDLKQVMSDAASLQVRVAFTEVEVRMVNETNEVNDLQNKQNQMLQEISRLSRIMDDHLNQVKPYDTRLPNLTSQFERTPAYGHSGSDALRKLEARLK